MAVVVCFCLIRRATSWARFWIFFGLIFITRFGLFRHLGCFKLYLFGHSPLGVVWDSVPRLYFSTFG